MAKSTSDPRGKARPAGVALPEATSGSGSKTGKHRETNALAGSGTRAGTGGKSSPGGAARQEVRTGPAGTKDLEKYGKAWFMKRRKEIDLSTWTETELVVLRRRSTRVFQKKQVPENLVRRILEAGRFAPSAGNNMHWRFSVVRDPAMLGEMESDARKLTAFMGNFLVYWKRPYLKPLVKVLQYRHPNDLHPIPHGVLKLISELSFKAFWGAPTLILLYKDVRGIGNPDLDLGICGQNMVIAAHSMGLGTCWVGLVKALRLYPKWRKKFDIRYPYSLEQALCVGYPVGEADGFVERDTHAIDWFDEKGKRVVY